MEEAKTPIRELIEWMDSDDTFGTSIRDKAIELESNSKDKIKVKEDGVTIWDEPKKYGWAPPQVDSPILDEWKLWNKSPWITIQEHNKRLIETIAEQKEVIEEMSIGEYCTCDVKGAFDEETIHRCRKCDKEMTS